MFISASYTFLVSYFTCLNILAQWSQHMKLRLCNNNTLNKNIIICQIEWMKMITVYQLLSKEISFQALRMMKITLLYKITHFCYAINYRSFLNTTIRINLLIHWFVYQIILFVNFCLFYYFFELIYLSIWLINLFVYLLTSWRINYMHGPWNKRFSKLYCW